METRLQLEELAMCLEYDLFDDYCVNINLLDVMKRKMYMNQKGTFDYYNKFLYKLIQKKNKEILKRIKLEDDITFFLSQMLNVDFIIKEINKEINDKTIETLIETIQFFMTANKNEDCIKLFQIVVENKEEFFSKMNDKQIDSLFDSLLQIKEKNRFEKEIDTLIQEIITYDELKGIPGEIFVQDDQISDLAKVIRITLINKHKTYDRLCFSLLKYTTIYELKYLIMIEKEIPLERIKLFHKGKELTLTDSDSISNLNTDTIEFDFISTIDEFNFNSKPIKDLLKQKYISSPINKQSFLGSIHNKKVEDIINDMFYKDSFNINDLCKRINDNDKKGLIYHLLFISENDKTQLRNEDITKMKRFRYFNRINEYGEVPFVIYNSSDIEKCNIETTLLYYHIQIFDLIDDIDNIWIPTKKQNSFINNYISIYFGKHYDITKTIDYLKWNTFDSTVGLTPENSIKMQNIVLFIFVLYECLQETQENISIKSIPENETIKRETITTYLKTLRNTTNFYVQNLTFYERINLINPAWFHENLKVYKKNLPYVLSVLINKVILQSEKNDLVYEIFTKHVYNQKRIISLFLKRDTSFLTPHFITSNTPVNNELQLFYEKLIIMGIHKILSINNEEQKQKEIINLCPYLIFYASHYDKIVLTKENYHELIVLMINVKNPNIRLSLYYFLFKQKQEPDQFIMFNRIRITKTENINSACCLIFNSLVSTLMSKDYSKTSNQPLDIFRRNKDNHQTIEEIPEEGTINDNEINNRFTIEQYPKEVPFHEKDKDKVQSGIFYLDEDLSYILFRCKNKENNNEYNHWIKFSTYFEFVSYKDIDIKKCIDNSFKSYLLLSDDPTDLNPFVYDFYQSILSSKSITDVPYQQISQSLTFMNYHFFTYINILVAAFQFEKMNEKVKEKISIFIKDNSFPFIVKLLNKGFIKKEHITDQKIKELLDNAY